MLNLVEEFCGRTFVFRREKGDLPEGVSISKTLFYSAKALKTINDASCYNGSA